MRSRLLVGYLAVMGVAIGGFAFAPESGWARVTWSVGVGWAAAAATVVGVRRYRPVAATAWLLFAAGVFLNTTGILVEQLVAVFAPTDSYPTIADAFWLGLYPCLIAGV